jgi:four helix bundle protein
MFIKLNHQSLDVYKAVRDLIKDIYFISKKLPAEEKFNMIQQIRRAALSIKLNLAEGSSRRSPVERKRIMEISRGSLIEVDAILETAVDLNCYSIDELTPIGGLLNKCFAMLSRMIK